MRIKYILIGIAVGVLLSSVAMVLAGDHPAGPGTAPDDTWSYTLEDIYKRLDAGTAGAKSAWSEPDAAPGTGTGHTLNEVMAKAPVVDDTHGATETQVLTGTTVWGLTSGAWGVITGTLECGSGGGATCEAGVPDTGQSTSYEDYDDGYYSATVGVDWPEPRFITGTTGVVTDTLTGLIWLENANCFGTRTWAQALTDANTLNSGECGLSDGSVEGDWRLPNARELYSLIHLGVYDPAVPNTAGTGQWSEGDPFTGVQSSVYWSSTTDAGYTSNAWYVHLNDGIVNSYDRMHGYYVWPVRGGQ